MKTTTHSPDRHNRARAPRRSRPILTAALTLVALVLTVATPATAAPQDDGPLKVIATVPTYGRLAETIGGDEVEVVVICRPGQDLHGVTATPSLVARVRDADLVLHTGLDAENWLAGLLRSSGNLDLLPGNSGSVSLSDEVSLKEVPTVVDRSQGDVHAFGNTHVWTDPLAVRAMAVQVRDALISARPGGKAGFETRHAAFHRALTEKLVDWLRRAAAFKGSELVTYHRSWIYLLDRFGFVRVGTVEPKPRVAPTASHLEALVETMEARGTHVIVREPWQHPQATEFLAEATGATVLELSTHPGFPEGVDGIIEHFEFNLTALEGAFAPPTDG